MDRKLKFEAALKGKKYGGELHNWAIREVTAKDTGEVLGHIAYGWKYGLRVWRTSAVVGFHDALDEEHGERYVETRSSYYLLVGAEATEAQKKMLYNTVYG